MKVRTDRQQQELPQQTIWSHSSNSNLASNQEYFIQSKEYQENTQNPTTNQDQFEQSKLNHSNIKPPSPELVAQFQEQQNSYEIQAQSSQTFPQNFNQWGMDQQFPPPFMMPYPGQMMNPFNMCMSGNGNQGVPQMTGYEEKFPQMQQQSPQIGGAQPQGFPMPQQIMKDQAIGLLTCFSVQESLEVISSYLQIVKRQKEYQNPEKLLRAVSQVNSNVIDIQSNIAKGHYIRRGKPAQNKVTQSNLAKHVSVKRSRQEPDSAKSQGTPTLKKAPSKANKQLQLTNLNTSLKDKEMELQQVKSATENELQEPTKSNCVETDIFEMNCEETVNKEDCDLRSILNPDQHKTGKRSKRRGRDMDEDILYDRYSQDHEDKFLQEIDNIDFEKEYSEALSDSFKSSHDNTLLECDIF